MRLVSSKVLTGLVAALGLTFSMSIQAGVYLDNVSIVEIIQWQDDSPVYIKSSTGVWCYLPAVEKNLYSLLLSVFATGKKVKMVCNDSLESYGGVPGHRIHRVIASQ